MGKPEAKRFAVVREFGHELVIVDEHADVAHRLDAEAAAVWRASDGRRPVESLAAIAGVPVPRAVELVEQLADRGLLTSAAGDTRRSMLRRAVMTGAAVAAAPAITSVLLPTPAQAFASQTPAPPQQTAPNSTNPPGDPPPDDPPPGDPPPDILGESEEQPTGGLSGAPTIAGAGDTAGTGGIAGARRRVPTGELPFTGTNVARTAAVGAALAATGVAGHLALRREHPPAP